MKHLFNLAIDAGLLTEALGNGDVPRKAESIPTETPAIVPRDGKYIYVLQPPDRAQIPLNPPSPDRVKGSIGVWTEYLTEVEGSTSWIGPDPSYIAVETTTTKNAEGADVTATVNKAVDVIKAENGGLDLILSPAFIEKVEKILKEVPPCTRKRLRRRQGPSCGLEGAARRISEDSAVGDLFSEQVHDEVSEEAGLDAGSDSAYGTDEDGFSEGAEGPPGSEAGETVEAVIVGTEADAAAIAAAAGEMEGAIVVGGITLTSVTFLGMLLKAFDTNGKVEPVYHIPPEDIQTVTKSKTETSTQTQTQTTTTSAASCPTGFPDCPDDCKATRVADPKPTDFPQWSCSEGKNKDCRCNPKSDVSVHIFSQDFENAIRFALEELEKIDDEPEEPEITCPNEFSNAPSKFFGDVAAGFCDYIKDDFDKTSEDLPFDIYGGKIARLSRRSAHLMRRTPPEDPEMYKDYVFWLSWIPKEGDCLMDKENICTEAFKKLVQSQPCGQNHGSMTNRMTIDAKIDVGCGEYKWKVEAPKKDEPEEPEKPGLGDLQCTDRHKHRDVQDGAQDTWAQAGCKWYGDGKTMKPGDKEVYWGPPGVTGASHMNYKISWKEDCEGFDEQSLGNPVEGEDVDCYSLMRENYKSCNNGGAGGYRDAGCLRYEFYVK